MKKYELWRFLIIFLPTSYFTILFYRDLFVVSQDNKLLFLAWGFPCLHLGFTCFQLLAMIAGKQYLRFKKFSVARSMPMFSRFFNHVRLNRLFISIKVNDRERILSGVFWNYPTSILIYVDIFGKMKIFTLTNLFAKFMWILANLIVLSILRFFIL
jgi:hypothetical protein